MPEPSPPKPRILVVGASDRAVATLLPAIHCLAGELELAGLWDPNSERLAAATWLWKHCPASDRLEGFDRSRVDLVAVTLPVAEVPDILRQLLEGGMAGVKLLLDVPALACRDLPRYCRQFAAVGVLQASPLLPTVRAARTLVAAGKIGTPQKLWLQHDCDLPDAIALARAFAGGLPVRYGRAAAFGPHAREYALGFPNGFQTSILGPCDYLMGRFALAGSAGLIVDYPLGASSTTQIGCAFEGEFFRGITVDGDLQPLGPRDWEFYDRLPYPRLPDDSLQALLTIRALMEVLHAAYQDDWSGVYSWRDGLYDARLLAFLEGASRWYDPLASQHRSLLGFGATRVLPAIEGMLARP